MAPPIASSIVPSLVETRQGTRDEFCRSLRRGRCATGADSLPAGTHPRSARPPGPPTAPTPRATARGGSRPRRTRRARSSRTCACPRARCRADRARRADRAIRPSCTGWTNPIASSTSVAGIENSLPGTSRIVFISGRSSRSRSNSTRTPCRRCDAPALARELRRHHRVLALAALFVRARHVEVVLLRQRPRLREVAPLGRLREQLDRRHRSRALAMRRADAVGAGVAAAEDHDVLTGRDDRFVVRHDLARDAPILLGQEVHREVHAGELAARHLEIARLLGAGAQQDRVEALAQLARPTDRPRRARRSGTRRPPRASARAGDRSPTSRA